MHSISFCKLINQLFSPLCEKEKMSAQHVLSVMLLLLLIATLSLQQQQDVNVRDTSTRTIVENGYLQLQFNKQYPQIDVLKADFLGEGQYGKNLIADKGEYTGVVLERQSFDGNTLKRHSSSFGAVSGVINSKILQNSTDIVSIVFSGIVDDYSDPTITSDWTVTLARGERSFDLRIVSSAVKDSSDTVNIRVSAYMMPISVFGLFNRGIQQMMNNTKHYFASTDKLQHWYSLGFHPQEEQIGCIDLRPKFKDNVIMVSNVFNTTEYRSGLQLLIAGTYSGKYDRWTLDTTTSGVTIIPIAQGQVLIPVNETIYGNNYDFPASLVQPGLKMKLEHIRSIFTGVYASPAGAIYSYQIPNVIAPTLMVPDRSKAYGDLYNFYDPDSWLSISTLSYSGDAYLQDQSRKLLETSLKFMLPTGQIPHHFFANETTPLQPIYVAISGATQTGPNCFWILAALQYVKATGDEEWLRQTMPSIEKALDFLTTMYNDKYQMIIAPGPLFIDVFIRSNFTSDTNAMMVNILREVAQAQIYLGSTDKAQKNVELAEKIAEGINKYLWNEDHYITQMNPDGTIRDFVDYDSNFLAVAFNIPSADRAQSILKRASKGTCLHGSPNAYRPTYVSEKFYSSPNCYLNNTGDSKVTMGRIGWAEAHARAVLNDADGILQYIVDPMIQEVIKHTWLYERYDCSSQPVHNPYYIEYPEMVVMLLRELVYGINIGLNTLVVNPIEKEFEYRIGDVHVRYSRDNVLINAPGAGRSKAIRIHNLEPNRVYSVEISYQQLVNKRVTMKSFTVTTDDQGMLSFDSRVSARYFIEAKLVTK
jgi:hypothetical protein